MSLKGVSCKIGPSILNSDLSCLYNESKRLIDSDADYLHLDVMDGHFVPNITIGHPVVKCLRNKMRDVFFETHMMVSNPEQWIEAMADSSVNQYTFHIESCDDVSRACRRIREAGMQVGLAIKPNTPVDALVQYIDLADLVLIMTVEPGFGGQKFMEEMMPKVSWLRKNYPTLNIEVDGGVNVDNIQCCAKAGANWIVSGTAVVGADNPQKVISFMRETVENAITARTEL